MVTGNEPDCVGVPAMVPALLAESPVKVRPSGNGPVSVRVLLPVPPRAWNFCMKGCPGFPIGDASEFGVRLIACGSSDRRRRGEGATKYVLNFERDWSRTQTRGDIGLIEGRATVKRVGEWWSATEHIDLDYTVACARASRVVVSGGDEYLASVAGAVDRFHLLRRERAVVIDGSSIRPLKPNRRVRSRDGIYRGATKPVCF
jgi:hypothetical protein